VGGSAGAAAAGAGAGTAGLTAVVVCSSASRRREDNTIGDGSAAAMFMVEVTTIIIVHRDQSDQARTVVGSLVVSVSELNVHLLCFLLGDSSTVPASSMPGLHILTFPQFAHFAT